MKKRVGIAGLILVVLFSASWLLKPKTMEDDNVTEAVKIGISFDSFVVERWQRELEMLISEANDRGYEVLVEIANEDIDKQTAQIQKLIDENVSVLIIVPNDVVALSDMINKAKEKGIKVIAYDRLIKQSDIDLYLSFDNVGIGEQMAEVTLSYLRDHADIADTQVPSAVDEAQIPESNNEEANEALSPIENAPFKLLVINGDPKDNNSAMIHDGLYHILQPAIDSGEIEIIEEIWASGWREQYAMTAVEKLINKGISFDAIICGNDVLAGGAIEVLSKWRLAGVIPVIGQDAELSACQRIVEGSQLATIYKPINRLATQCIDAVDLLLRPNQTRWEGDAIFNGNAEVPYIKLQTVVVTADNMADAIVNSGFHANEDVYRNYTTTENQ